MTVLLLMLYSNLFPYDSMKTHLYMYVGSTVLIISSLYIHNNTKENISWYIYADCCDRFLIRWSYVFVWWILYPNMLKSCEFDNCNLRRHTISVWEICHIDLWKVYLWMQWDRWNDCICLQKTLPLTQS